MNIFKIFLLPYCITILLFTPSSIYSQNPAGVTVVDSMISGGLTRTYRLYIPNLYNSATPVPLVFNIHGYTMTAAQEGFYANFIGIADTANFIIVHPQGLPIDPQGMPTTSGTGYGWTNFSPVSEPNRDIQFLSDLLDLIKSKYNVNLNRIYSTGFSNGGFMSYDLACFMSTRFAAVASVSGSMNIQHMVACNPQHPMPIMHIHGTNDHTLSYTGDSASINIDSLIKFWVKFNHCDTIPNFTSMPDINHSDSSTAEHYVYTGGDQGSTVELFKIIGGSHTWPGAPVNISSYITNRDIDASKEIWRFFSQQKSFVGINDNINNDIHFSIYPNPFTMETTFSFSQEQKKTTVKIMDVLGDVIKTVVFAGKQCVIAKEEMSAGIYFVQITDANNNVVNRKIVVE